MGIFFKRSQEVETTLYYRKGGGNVSSTMYCMMVLFVILGGVGILSILLNPIILVALLVAIFLISGK